MTQLSQFFLHLLIQKHLNMCLTKCLSFPLPSPAIQPCEGFWPTCSSISLKITFEQGWSFLITFSQKFYWSVIEIVKAYGDVDTLLFWSATIDQNVTLLAKYILYLIVKTTLSFCTSQMHRWWVAWPGNFKLFFSRTHLNGSYVVRHSMS